MVTVCAVVPPPERARLDAAGDGCFTTLHADSFHDVLSTARRQRIDALVISVHRCGGVELPVVARFVHEFPAIPAVALVSRHDRGRRDTPPARRPGVRAAVDCTEPAGWRRLRDLVGRPASPAAARVLERLVPDLQGTTAKPDSSLRRGAPGSGVAHRAGHRPPSAAPAQHTDVPFYRAGFRSQELPRRHAARARRILLESPGLSVADVAYRLDYSSPQSSAGTQGHAGLSAGEYRTGSRSTSP